MIKQKNIIIFNYLFYIFESNKYRSKNWQIDVDLRYNY